MKTLVAYFLLAISVSGADITITIPDAQVPRVLDAIAGQLRYTGKKPDGTNETKAQFARRMFARWVAQQVKEYEGAQAATAARETAETAVDAIGIQ